MEKNDKALQIIGVDHIATKNSLTVRARVYLRRTYDGKVYSFDTDVAIWDLVPMGNITVEDDFSLVRGIPQ